MQLTTVTQHSATFHEGEMVVHEGGLKPATQYQLHGIDFETLPDLGTRLSTFATCNDVHFGETECGVVSGQEMGPIFSVASDEMPYPEMMNAAAIEEIKAIEPDAILVKGDLTCNGTAREYEDFKKYYATAFGEKLFYVRGNHEAYRAPEIQTKSQIKIDLAGATLLMIDTVRPGLTGGTVFDHELEWLADVSRDATQPVLVFGHHQIWDPSTPYRSEDYFGIQPDESERLIKLIADRPAIKGYFSGHTHRNRVRYFPATKQVPWVEIGSVKDFPGMWAEYQVYDNGILQIGHRINKVAALAWTEKTKKMYRGSYEKYAFGRLEDRCFVF